MWFVILYCCQAVMEFSSWYMHTSGTLKVKFIYVDPQHYEHNTYDNTHTSHEREREWLYGKNRCNIQTHSGKFSRKIK